jgi:hypothetical protein
LIMTNPPAPASATTPSTSARRSIISQQWAGHSDCIGKWRVSGEGGKSHVCRIWPGAHACGAHMATHGEGTLGFRIQPGSNPRDGPITKQRTPSTRMESSAAGAPESPLAGASRYAGRLGRDRRERRLLGAGPSPSVGRRYILPRDPRTWRLGSRSVRIRCKRQVQIDLNFSDVQT